MIIAIPTDGKRGLEESVAEHFGRCETYTFLDEEGGVIEIIENIGEHKGGTELPPEIIKKHGANVVLCKGIGPKALNLCKQLGIEVFIGQAETVKEIFELWKKNKIKKADFGDVCGGFLSR